MSYHLPKLREVCKWYKDQNPQCAVGSTSPFSAPAHERGHSCAEVKNLLCTSAPHSSYLPLVPRPEPTRWRMCKFAKCTMPAMEPETAWANLYSHTNAKHHQTAKVAYVRDKYGDQSEEVKELFEQIMERGREMAEKAKKAREKKAKEPQDTDKGQEQGAEQGGEFGAKRYKRPNGLGQRRRANDAETQDDPAVSKPTRTAYERGCQTMFRTAHKCVHRHHSQADFESHTAAQQKHRGRGATARKSHAFGPASRSPHACSGLIVQASMGKGSDLRLRGSCVGILEGTTSTTCKLPGPTCCRTTAARRASSRT